MTKKMYKKPQTEKVTLEPNEVTMERTLGVSNGGEKHGDLIAD